MKLPKLTPKNKKIMIVVGVLLVTAIILYFVFRKKTWLPKSLRKRIEAGEYGSYNEANPVQDWGSFASAIRTLLGNPQDQTLYDFYHRQVLGFFKGHNMEPSGFAVQTFDNYILEYLESGDAVDAYLVETGQYL